MRVYVGERMTLRFNVQNKEGKEFTISDGDYTVMLGEAVQMAGKLTIKGHELSFVFAPTEPGVHRISIWYDIGTDRRKGEFPVEVIP